jgi:hypothetical protein
MKPNSSEPLENYLVWSAYRAKALGNLSIAMEYPGRGSAGFRNDQIKLTQRVSWGLNWSDHAVPFRGCPAPDDGSGAQSPVLAWSDVSAGKQPVVPGRTRNSSLPSCRCNCSSTDVGNSPTRIYGFAVDLLRERVVPHHYRAIEHTFAEVPDPSPTPSAANRLIPKSLVDDYPSRPSKEACRICPFASVCPDSAVTPSTGFTLANGLPL